MSREPHRLGELQLAILQILWKAGEASASGVHRALEARELAPTTIATMLRKMEDRGLVGHRAEGRQFVYRALLREDEVSTSMVGDLVKRVFRGDPLALVDHLVRAGEVDLAELDALRAKVGLDEGEDQAAPGRAPGKTSNGGADRGTLDV